MKLQKYEDKIRDLAQKDINDPKIFELLVEMCYEFFRRRHLMNTEWENRNASLILAENLYMKMMDGFDFYHILGYIGVSYHSAIREYKKNCGPENFDCSCNPELADALVEMGMCKSITKEQYRERMELEFIESLPKMIDKVLQSCNYDEYSSDYMNAKLSIMLSLIAGKTKKANGDVDLLKYDINNDNLEYVKFLYQNVQNKIRDDIRYDNQIDYLNGMTLTQLYTLENFVDIED